jgi:hypothetical protein
MRLKALRFWLRRNASRPPASSFTLGQPGLFDKPMSFKEFCWRIADVPNKSPDKLAALGRVLYPAQLALVAPDAIGIVAASPEHTLHQRIVSLLPLFPPGFAAGIGARFRLGKQRATETYWRGVFVLLLIGLIVDGMSTFMTAPPHGHFTHRRHTPAHANPHRRTPPLEIGRIRLNDRHRRRRVHGADAGEVIPLSQE